MCSGQLCSGMPCSGLQWFALLSSGMQCQGAQRSVPLALPAWLLCLHNPTLRSSACAHINPPRFLSADCDAFLDGGGASLSPERISSVAGVSKRRSSELMVLSSPPSGSLVALCLSSKGLFAALAGKMSLLRLLPSFGVRKKARCNLVGTA